VLKAHASPKQRRKETVEGARLSGALKTKAREDSPVTVDSAPQILSPNMRSRRTEPSVGKPQGLA
jgi:hypothetical protein